MSQTIGEYLYRIAWSLDKSGAANLKKEGDAAQKSVDGLGKSLDKTEREAQDLTRAADKTAPAVRNIGTAAIGVGSDLQNFDELANKAADGLKKLFKQFVAFATVRRTFFAIINTATQLDALANSAAAVGASASGMARLAYATDLAGVNASEMDTALKGVRQSAAQAAAGIGAGVKAWRLIGISTRDENGNLKDTTKLIDELGAKFAQMDEGRAQALGKMLKMTPAVIGALRSGMMDYAREFDQALGSMTPTFDEAVKAAQRLHAAQSRLTRISTLLWQGIASRFFEPFAKAFDSLRQTIIINQGALVRFGAAVLQPLALALSGVAESVSVVSNALSVLTSAFDALGPVAQSAVQTLLWGAAAYLLVLKRITVAQISAALTNPFVLIGAAIVAVLLLLDDFAVAMRGGKSYFDWTPVVEFAKKVRTFGDDIVKWFKALPDKISEAFKNFGDKIKAMWTDVVNWLTSKWDAFIKTVTGWMPDALKKQLGIKVEGEQPAAPEFKPAATAAPVAQVLDTAPERRQLIRELGGETPAASQQPAAIPEQGRGMAAFKAATERAAAAAPAAQPAAVPAQVVTILGTASAAPAETPMAGVSEALAAPALTIPEIEMPEIRMPGATITAPSVTVESPAQSQAASPSPAMPTPQQFAAALAGVTASKSDTPRTPIAAAAPAAQAVKVMDTVAAGGRALASAQPLGTTTVTNNNDNSRKYDIPVTVNNSTTVNVQTMDSNAGAVADQVGSAVDASNAKMVRDMQSPLAAIADDDGGGMTTE